MRLPCWSHVDVGAVPKALVAGSLVVVLGVAGGVTLGAQTPELNAEGPTAMNTEFTGVFTVGERTVRQFRYEDDDEVEYTFRLTNSGRYPVTVTGLSEEQERSKLLSYRELRGADGSAQISLGAGATEEVVLRVGMDECETLSARAGSFATVVNVTTESLGLFDDEVSITLPEELRTGSPREAFCPGATTTSRPRA